MDTRMLLDAASRGLTVAELLDEMLGTVAEPTFEVQEDGSLRARHLSARRQSVDRPKPQPWTRRAEPEAEPVRTRNGVGARKHYEVIRSRSGKTADPKLAPSYMAVWKALLKSRKPLTAREVTAIVDCPHKTTESAIYWLRQAGAIRPVGE